MHERDTDGSGAGGRDVIEDFAKGQDTINLSIDYYDADFDGTATFRGFDDLDSNNNGVLDNSDTYVSVGKFTHDGATAASTTIDVTGFVGSDGLDSLVVFNVTGLTGADFT